MELIYAIIHSTKPMAYIGRTSRSLNERWAEHLSSAAVGTDKLLYEEMRHAPHEWEIVECELSETASEAEWMQKFTDDGFTLLNQTGGNRVQPKRRTVAKLAQQKAITAQAPVQYPEGHSAKVFKEMMDEIEASRPKYQWERIKIVPWIAGVGYEQDVLSSIKNSGVWKP